MVDVLYAPSQEMCCKWLHGLSCFRLLTALEKLFRAKLKVGKSFCWSHLVLRLPHQLRIKVPPLYSLFLLLQCQAMFSKSLLQSWTDQGLSAIPTCLRMALSASVSRTFRTLHWLSAWIITKPHSPLMDKWWSDAVEAFPPSDICPEGLASK